MYSVSVSSICPVLFVIPELTFVVLMSYAVACAVVTHPLPLLTLTRAYHCTVRFPFGSPDVGKNCRNVRLFFGNVTLIYFGVPWSMNVVFPFVDCSIVSCTVVFPLVSNCRLTAPVSLTMIVLDVIVVWFADENCIPYPVVVSVVRIVLPVIVVFSVPDVSCIPVPVVLMIVDSILPLFDP